SVGCGLAAWRRVAGDARGGPPAHGGSDVRRRLAGCRVAGRSARCARPRELLADRARATDGPERGITPCSLRGAKAPPSAPTTAAVLQAEALHPETRRSRSAERL